MDFEKWKATTSFRPSEIASRCRRGPGPGAVSASVTASSPSGREKRGSVSVQVFRQVRASQRSPTAWLLRLSSTVICSSSRPPTVASRAPAPALVKVGEQPSVHVAVLTAELERHAALHRRARALHATCERRRRVGRAAHEATTRTPRSRRRPRARSIPGTSGPARGGRYRCSRDRPGSGAASIAVTRNPCSVEGQRVASRRRSRHPAPGPPSGSKAAKRSRGADMSASTRAARRSPRRSVRRTRCSPTPPYSGCSLFTWPILRPGRASRLAVEVQAGVGLGGQRWPSCVDLVAQQIGHLDPGVGRRRAQRPAGDGADVLFELVAPRSRPGSSGRCCGRAARSR